MFNKNISHLSPSSQHLNLSVQTVQTTISRHILPSRHPRCYRVCSQSRRRRRSLVASSLDELLQQAARVFTACCWDDLTLVLEEDGTVVDSEEFLQSLSGSAQLMVLSRGEMWTHSKPRKSGVAKLTFDLYKLHPEAFLCCLGVRATLYKTYSLSYDFRCTRAKHVLSPQVCNPWLWGHMRPFGLSAAVLRSVD
uniref:Cell death inducing DFFA like effector a n=1 Tax=Kryptolebias marmoratus TaxID=37003 RepID=A0A3Q3AA55_KRYMA